ncbi:hypothetical protein P8C59_000876 [Phyllachora maydis]|uniref:Acyltransferase 3 domain-containing protein n=1 Tax=Phyllachora maydis TaxID=1825666 RepID=A0AAD9HYB3_9PEZI|nr:hypothetical protein P8C59_000876 [Phyllachora maydis]
MSGLSEGILASSRPWHAASLDKDDIEIWRTKAAVEPDGQLASLVSRAVVGPASGDSSRTPTRPTAYLDGLRGFAALVVYWHHHQLWAHEAMSRDGLLENAWGHHGERHFATLPIVRNVFTGGHFAVATFFVISGYALSAKSLGLIHASSSSVDGASDARTRLGDTLASALFRRWLRLYLPLVAICFGYMCLWHGPCGGIWTDGFYPRSTFSEELWFFYAEFKNFSFVFGGGSPWFSYNPHTWSIPTEFKGSLVVYTTLLAFSRCARHSTRLALEMALAAYFLLVADGWYCALFVAGMLLCDLDLLAAHNRLPAPLARLGPHKAVLARIVLLVALLLGGVPSHTADVADLRQNPGWYYLSLLKPQAVFDYKWFYLFFAASGLVFAARHLRMLRRVLEGPACQRLGRISYALYLVHGPVIWTLGDRLYSAAGWPRPTFGDRADRMAGWEGRWPLPGVNCVMAGGGGRWWCVLGLEPAFLLPQLVLLPVTLGLAVMLTRLVDEPCVRLAQGMYGWVTRRPETGRGLVAV